MAIEVSSDKAVCTKCGTEYSRRKGYFPVSYALLHKGIGYIPVCKDCIDTMYNAYLSQCNNAEDAVRQVCRKLDLYWSKKVFDVVARKTTTRSMMTQYIAKINTVTYAGKSYDDTLSEEGSLWNFETSITSVNIPQAEEVEDSGEEVDEDIIAFWGTGYTPEMYNELERKRAYWVSKFPENTVLDVGTETIIKQICGLELDISRDRAAGRAVDKSINALNTLLGSANMKPAQQKNDGDGALENTPFGVWVRKWENQRPIPEPDPELKDVDGIIRYISIWFLGHLCKMLGIKNTYCKLYEDELAKMRIERPEYEDDDDETMFNNIFNSDSNNDDSGGVDDEP